jgi:hypothetical protein
MLTFLVDNPDALCAGGLTVARKYLSAVVESSFSHDLARFTFCARNATIGEVANDHTHRGVLIRGEALRHPKPGGFHARWMVKYVMLQQFLRKMTLVG